jgi:hypothetical protein
MPYDHYLFDIPDMGEALGQISENGEQIVGMFYAADSSQVCIVVRTEKVDLDNAIKTLFKKDDDDA